MRNWVLNYKQEEKQKTKQIGIRIHMTVYHVRRNSSIHPETDCSIGFLLNILRNENEGDLFFSLLEAVALPGAVV